MKWICFWLKLFGFIDSLHWCKECAHPEFTVVDGVVLILVSGWQHCFNLKVASHDWTKIHGGPVCVVTKVFNIGPDIKLEKSQVGEWDGYLWSGFWAHYGANKCCFLHFFCWENEPLYSYTVTRPKIRLTSVSGILLPGRLCSTSLLLVMGHQCLSTPNHCKWSLFLYRLSPKRHLISSSGMRPSAVLAKTLNASL